MNSSSIVMAMRCAFFAGVVCIVAACQSQPTPPSAAPEATRSPATAPANAPPPEEAPATSAASANTGPLAPLAWLQGCWQGEVNEREFREQWMPPRGGMLIGAGQQASRGRMQDFEFLQLEARADGIYFTQFSGDRKAESFKLASTTTDDKDTVYTFANTADAFPARLVYRRGTDGWLYETIEGPLNGADKKVIYPMRRIDCESGALIHR
jgi:hypothetical protein